MNLNQQKDNLPRYEEYHSCVVAFIDILGFDSKVRNIKSEEDFDFIANLLFDAIETATAFNQADGLLNNLKMTSISDSMILSMPENDPICPNALIQILQKIQYDILTGYETLLRGYMTRGRVYHKKGVLFGEGYSDAYRKEKESGFAPRIVIDPILIEYAKEIISNYKGKRGDMTSVFEYIKEDNYDGYYFVDYLKPNGMLSMLSKELLTSGRNNIKAFVEKSLNEYRNEQKKFKKYEWLEKYLEYTEQYFN